MFCILFQLQSISYYLKSDGLLVGVEETLPSASNKTYNVLWYNPPPYLILRQKAHNRRFDTCEYSNCKLTFKKAQGEKSNAIIFDGRMFTPLPFKRPKHQVWIFAAHEAPAIFNLTTQWRKLIWIDSFNWTMAYDRHNTDIYLPYGELRQHRQEQKRDFEAIAKEKTKDCLMIVSHCTTDSKREKYVQELKKYIDIDVFGGCGTPMKCGKRFVHDECFNKLNSTYRFYLAFENAYCRQYFSEKFFENFNYDTIMVTLGGERNESTEIFPKEAFISTDSFQSPKQLAEYLKKLSKSTEDYAALLRRKGQYYSVDYSVVYQRALCDICKRLNHSNKYRKTIPNIIKWANPPCELGPRGL